MRIQDLVFKPDTAEKSALVFALIAERYDDIERVYRENSFSFYDHTQLFSEAAKFILPEDPEKIKSFLETGKVSLRFECSRKIYDNSGFISRAVFDEDEIIAIVEGIDLGKTLLFANTEFIAAKARELDLHRTIISAQLKANLLRDNSLTAANAYPACIRVDTYDGKMFLIYLALQKVTEEMREQIMRHFLIFIGCLSLEARFEAYAFYQKHKLAIRRLVASIRSRDSFSRMNMDIFAQELVTKVATKQSLVKYEKFADDMFMLYLMDCSRDDVEANSGLEFENTCLEILVRNGYAAYLTKTSGDYGADIIAEKDNLSYCIQCKCLSRPVGIKAVQEVVAAQKHYACDYAAIISTTTPTQPALELAKSGNIAVINVDGIPGLEFMF